MGYDCGCYNIGNSSNYVTLKSKIPFKKFSKTTAIYRIIKKSRSSKRFNNIKNLWIINNRFNKLSFYQNIISIISISFNSIKKYGFK